MGILELVFIERIQRTAGVVSFRFRPIQRINFFPGQFLQVVFDKANRNNKELNKYLSLSCSPGKEYIEVTKKISDSRFSQRLMKLKPGDKIQVNIPMGNCVFYQDYKNIVFLIGGIGITPVISILEYIADGGLDTSVSLFYSNRTEEEIAFKKELDSWSGNNKNIHVYYTVTDCQPKEKSCLFGQINKELLVQKACELKEKVIFIFGPPKMVEAMEKLALELNGKKENIKVENFIGY